MIRPSKEVVKALAVLSRQQPEILGWLTEWRQHELEQLPHAISAPAVFQGRCQVLNELYTLVKEAPALAAKA